MDCRRIVILTEGATTPLAAKTAINLLRYRPQDILAVMDSQTAGRTAGPTLGMGGDTPIIASLAQAPEADSVFVGIAPSGGALPASWRPLLLDAIERGLHIVSGLHDFLCDDVELAEKAAERGVELIDVRRNTEHYISRCVEFNPHCLRILTVGQDCSVGKMTVTLELEKPLRGLNIDAKFLATGQTGIMVRGEGIPLDCVVADFINGAAEKLVLDNQHHEILLIEGQGSITHPSFSSVTLGLLHGCAPHAMILCYEVGRDRHKSVPGVAIRPLADLIEMYESMASVRHPSTVIGVAMNSRFVSESEADYERRIVSRELGLPVCDVFRHGVDDLMEPIVALYKRQANESSRLAAKLLQV